MKIIVYAISKNEEKFVDRFMDSCALADAVIVADTGSTDRTVELLRNRGAIVHEISITPWRFDKARDAALALVPRDADVCVSIDLDEILEDGWREEIERLWKPGITRLRYGYDWGQGIRFQYEKIHARHGYFWHHPCHEYPRPDPRIQERYAETQQLLVTHLPDMTKSRGQYLDLLRTSIIEDPDCPRNAFYFARELTFYEQWDEAITQLQRYLLLPKSTWKNERCYACRLLGKAYSVKKDHVNAKKWYLAAIKEAPNTREPWCDFAHYLYDNRNWQDCLYCVEALLNITDREYVYTCDPAVWGSLPYDLACIASWELGRKEEAVKYITLALEKDPTNERLQENMKTIKECL